MFKAMDMCILLLLATMKWGNSILDYICLGTMAIYLVIRVISLLMKLLK